jgi:Animal haem peroxidase
MVDHGCHADHGMALNALIRHRRRGPDGARSRRLKRPLTFAFAALLVIGGSAVTAGSASADEALGFEIQSLDGHGNNLDHPEWGQSGTNYSRLRPGRYSDGRGGMIRGPNPRRVSNRIFNDSHQNLFSESSVTQWGFAWGQFLDHTFGLRQAPGVGNAPDPSSQNIKFDVDEPLEEFESNTGEIPFTRSSVAEGTGADNPREQVNTVSSYIDAFSVYGGNNGRLEWLRDGSVDGNITNNRATLLLPGGYLPRRDARGDAATAPVMDIDGRLRAQPNKAAVAGDVRANENIALQATHTLFAREHNRIVRSLPASLSEEAKF